MTTALAPLLARVVGAGGMVRLEVYDGSAAGAEDASVRVVLRTPTALAYLLQAPGELGLARAYVTGELEVHGELYDLLRQLTPVHMGALSWRERLELLRALGPAVLRPAGRPAEELPGRLGRRLLGALHSKDRDAAVVSHHYDVSNRFYEWVLGPSMAYTCAVFPRTDATLEQAQHEKFDLVCRKLDLRPGMRLLDVGCGWGGMVMHAAEHYGVQALGVTLSRQQAEYGQKIVADAGLADQAEIRHADYRDVTERDFDAISSIGLTEHIGKAQLPAYFRFLHSRLRVEGRLLNHSIMRPTTTERARCGPFIDRYVFPDGEMEGIGHVVSAMQDTGFEVRHEENLREHYARTLTGWTDNLAAHWAEAVEEVGVARARVWMLYMTGSRLAFERRQLELHQVLGVKVGSAGSSGMPLRPTWGA